jgi:hypothetical protein
MDLERELKAVKAPPPEAPAIAQPPPAEPAPAAQGSPVSPAAVKNAVREVLAELPIKVGGSVRLRGDVVDVEDEIDLLEDDTDSTARGQIRLWVLYESPDRTVNGGLRLAIGQTPNPAGSYERLGDLFRPESAGFDQFYIGFRPFRNLGALGLAQPQNMPLQLEALSLTAGKMPQPFWRGSMGPFRSQMVWDWDISPVGATVSDTLIQRVHNSLEMHLDNTFGFFILNDSPDIRFDGITGETYLFANQLHLDSPHLGIGAAYYHYDNLNAGLRAPSFDPGSSAFLRPGHNAFLLGDGLQRTNNQVNYGTGADGFVEDHFDVFNVLGQAGLALPLPKDEQGRPHRVAEFVGDPHFMAVVDYAHNFAVDQDEDGYYVGGGFYGGDFEGDGLHPWEIHFLWGDVDADAVLATFANSDLGGGTDYRGWEIAWNYRLTRNLQFLMSYFDYDGHPEKSNHVQRLYVDFALTF